MYKSNLVVELAVDRLPIPVHQFEGMRSIAVHVPEAIGDAPVAKQKRDLVGRLGTEREEVPEHVHVLEQGKRQRTQG